MTYEAVFTLTDWDAVPIAAIDDRYYTVTIIQDNLTKAIEEATTIPVRDGWEYLGTKHGKEWVDNA